VVDHSLLFVGQLILSVVCAVDRDDLCFFLAHRDLLSVWRRYYADTPLMMVKLTIGVSDAVPATDAIVTLKDVAATIAVTKAT